MCDPGLCRTAHPRQQHRENERAAPEWGTSLAGMLLEITCISLEVFRGHHDHEPNGTLISEHLIGPPADGAHALHGSNAVVGDEDLRGMRTWGIRLGPLLAAGAQDWGPAPREGSAGGEQSRAAPLTQALCNSWLYVLQGGSFIAALMPSTGVMKDGTLAFVCACRAKLLQAAPMQGQCWEGVPLLAHKHG